MGVNVLKRFSSDLLSDRLESAGFKRKGNAWFKTVPDVLLCVEVRKIRGPAFDMTFGIVPFVCIKLFELNLGCFQPDGAYSRKYHDEVVRFFNDLTGTAIERSPRFFYHIDSTVKKLNDERQYDVLLRYWTDVFEKAVSPFLFSVHDLKSAVDAIDEYCEFSNCRDIEEKDTVNKKTYMLEHVPALLKLGRTQIAFDFLDGLYGDRFGEKQAMLELEKTAESFWREGKFTHPYLWYYLMKNDDQERLKAIITELEEYACDWLAKNKIEIAVPLQRPPI